MSNILTKADIQNYAPELDLSVYNDTTISGMISQATERAAGYCNVAGFDFQAVTNETDRAYISNEGDLTISVRRRPIVSVNSISLVKGGFSTSLTLTASGTGNLYQIPYGNTKLVFPNSYFYLTGTYLAGGASQLYTLRGARVMYQASYAGGYQTIPDDLKYAVSLYFRDIYSKRGAIGQSGASISSFSQGSYSENYVQNNDKVGRSAYVKEAEDVLLNGDYARVEF